MASLSLGSRPLAVAIRWQTRRQQILRKPRLQVSRAATLGQDTRHAAHSASGGAVVL